MLRGARSKNRDIPMIQCKGCFRPFAQTRVDKEFCKPKCKSAYHNTKRREITASEVLSWIRLNPREVTSLLSQEYATVQEAAAITGKSETTIRKWIKQQRVTAEVYNGRLIILRSDLSRLPSGGPAAHAIKSEAIIGVNYGSLRAEANNESGKTITTY